MQFGVKVILGICIVNLLYFILLRKDFRLLKWTDTSTTKEREKTPIWITTVHISMAAFRKNNTAITILELLKTGITIALLEAFFDLTITVNTLNLPCAG